MSYPEQGWQQPQYQPQQAHQGAPAYGQRYAAPQMDSGLRPGWDAPPTPQHGAHAMPEPGQPQCRICACTPAARTTFHGHKTQYIWMYFLRAEGPFCHDCGMATYRRMTANTLVQGWWGPISCIATPITVLINLTRRGNVANLPAPIPPPAGGHGQPLDPGKPLYGRVKFWIGILLPSCLIFLLIFLSILTSEWNQAVHHVH